MLKLKKKYNIMIIIVFGLPGTGKTYFSEYLANEIDAVHLNTDKVRHALNKQEQYDKKTKQLVYDRLKNEMVANIKKGFNVIVDGTFHKKAKRRQFIEKSLNLDQKLYFIQIKTTDAIAKKRLQKRRDFSEADFKVYQQIKYEFEPFNAAHLELWSDDGNIKNMIERAKVYIYG